jgi:hypothetical protein
MARGVKFGVVALALGLVLSFAACAKVDQAGTGTGGSGLGLPGSGGSIGTGSGIDGGVPLSGSGGRTLLGGNGQGGEMSCGLETFDLERRPVDILVLLDRSASMARDSMDKDIPAGSTTPSKWSQIVPALADVVTTVGGDISWGFKSFPEDGAQCAQATLTSKIDVPISPKNGAAIAAQASATMPLGNGTPTGGVFDVAKTYLSGVMNDHRKFILFATDGQPSCSGTLGTLSFSGGGSMAAVSAATTAIGNAAAAGFPTFVVGVATKASDTKTLNDWAIAGGEARPDPNPIATKFYLGSTKDELVAAFTAITTVAQTCVFNFTKAPPVPTKIAVKVSGVKAPADPTHADGWDYTDSTNMAVEVFGSWCDMIKTTAANKVEIIFGCPNIDIP